MPKDRILIVNSNPKDREFLRTRVLQPEGYYVLEAETGPAGLRMALEEHPDIIILDDNLEGMRGLELLRTLREQDKRTPVIFTTSKGSQELVVQVLRLEVHDYFIKPFEPEDMAYSVAGAVKKGVLLKEQDELVEELEKVNQKLRRQVQELNILHSIGQAVTSLLDLDRVLTRVVEAAVFLTQAEEGLLLLIDNGELVLRAAKNIEEHQARQFHILVRDSLAGQVVESGEPLLVVDGRAKVATGYLAHSLIYAPVRAPGRGIIGVLGVLNRESEHSFSAEDVRLLSTLAAQAAIALENARLYNDAEAERTQLMTVLREVEEGIIILDPDLNIILCNPTAITALGLPTEGVVGQALDVLSSPMLQELVPAAVKAAKTLHTELTTEANHTYNVQITPIPSVGYCLTMQDITHLKELDRVKSEFVATVSHDLRTPLTAIQGYVSLLEKVGPLNEQQRTFVERVTNSITNITELIGDLLDLGRIEADYDLEMEPLHLEVIIDTVVDEFRTQTEERRLELDWEKQSLPLVRGNPRRLRQVMENLLSNAVKYTQEGGRIAVEARQDGAHIVVQVSDTGIGIPLEDQPFIFDRFYRVRSEDTEKIAGTGLGLAIVKSVIEKHGGRIWVESQPGEGATFTFVLHTIE